MKHFFYLLFWLLSGAALNAAPELPVIHWRKLPDLPSPGGGHLVLADHGKVLVLGGTFWRGGVKYRYDRVLRLDVDGRDWIEESKLPLPLGYMVGCRHDGKLIFAGGTTVGDQDNPRTYIRTNDGRWTVVRMTGSPPFGAAAATDGHRLFAVGGLLRSNDWKSVTNQLLILDLDHPEHGWQTGPPLPGEGRALAALCVHRERLYLFGGADGNIENRSECWTMELASGVWTRLPDLPVAVRYALALPWKNRIILIANCLTGKDHQTVTSNRIFIFDPDTRQWSPGGLTPYTAAADGAICGNRIYLIGGEDKGQSRVATCAVGVLEENAGDGAKASGE